MLPDFILKGWCLFTVLAASNQASIWYSFQPDILQFLPPPLNFCYYNRQKMAIQFFKFCMSLLIKEEETFSHMFAS